MVQPLGMISKPFNISAIEPSDNQATAAKSLRRLQDKHKYSDKNLSNCPYNEFMRIIKIRKLLFAKY
jgi:hypothetical protein